MTQEEVERVLNLLMDTMEMHQTILERQNTTLKIQNTRIELLEGRVGGTTRR